MHYGVASRCITPARPVRLAGYAARDRNSEGVYQDLFVRALALDADDAPVVIVTADVLYFDENVLDPVERELLRGSGIPPDRLFFAASHTHCGPTVRRYDAQLYGWMDPAYLDELRGALVAVVREAVASMAPGTLHAYRGRCDIGINRRLKTPSGVQMRPNPAGPVDRDVDILVVRDENGDVRAVLFGYACHPTTMGGYLIGPDYPGFARRVVEASFPGAMALFAQGCSGDVRPNNTDGRGAFKSGPIEVVEAFGRRLGCAVVSAIHGPGRPVKGPLRTASVVAELPLAPHPSRTFLAAALKDPSPHRRRWAWTMLDAYARGAPLPMHEPVHVQSLRIGDAFDLVTIAGEVCVEIGLRIKELIGDKPRFVLGYTNRVRGYIPSKNVSREGGYEAESYFYRGAPSPYADSAEDILVETARRMLASGG